MNELNQLIFKMTTLGGNIKDINAVIGPTIQKTSYEIGNDVFKVIKKTDVLQKIII